MSKIIALAQAQLSAYNAADLDAFVGCYHPDVRVFSGEEQTIVGSEAFRERYRDLFVDWEFGATVSQQLSVENHCVDLEHWWRVDPQNQQRETGTILVRYTLREGRIGTVQFLS